MSAPSEQKHPNLVEQEKYWGSLFKVDPRGRRSKKSLPRQGTELPNQPKARSKTTQGKPE